MNNRYWSAVLGYYTISIERSACSRSPKTEVQTTVKGNVVKGGTRLTTDLVKVNHELLQVKTNCKKQFTDDLKTTVCILIAKHPCGLQLWNKWPEH